MPTAPARPPGAPSQRLAALALAILLEAALVLSWSGGFVGIRFAIDYAPIFSILLWRSLVSGLLLLPFALALGTAALAWATLLQNGSPSKTMPVYQKLCIQCLSAAAIFAMFAWHEGSVLPALTAGFMGGVLWLVFVATFGAWRLYYLALRHTSAARAAQPAVAAAQPF